MALECVLRFTPGGIRARGARWHLEGPGPLVDPVGERQTPFAKFSVNLGD